MTDEEIGKELAKRMDEMFMTAAMGPVRKQPKTALRLRGNGFEAVEL